MKLSAYRKGCLGKRGRKFLSSFLDLVMKFILVMVFFAISDAIMHHVPAFVERQEEASAAQADQPVDKFIYINHNPLLKCFNVQRYVHFSQYRQSSSKYVT